eukprot:CAMPEP_0169446776 /NCGR_PEP_ID=MMETSP1042-20121227/11157_1 /TAXON_ID=464988 /ORGANISM="Hemiselmis andersenii, Strain CCMP1180" /LENGTH=257 /DNA_ID=CAMNT_0009558269 /DNA_START=54 /DNA_END=828 /DNA_ORIENTATION=+
MFVASGVDRQQLVDSMRGSTLVMTDVSVGNVGQLSADLLIATYQMERVAFFDDDAVVPIIGADAEGVVRTSLELYRGKQGVFVLQQRSALVPSKTSGFCERMCKWIHSSGFKLVLFLTSLPSSIRVDRQLADQGQQLSALCGLKGGASRARVEELGGSCWGWGDESLHHEAVALREQTDAARGLAEGCAGLGVDLCALAAFCEEGDNVADGVQMASRVCEFLGSGGGLPPPEKGFRAPASWRLMQEELARAQRVLYA